MSVNNFSEPLYQNLSNLLHIAGNARTQEDFLAVKYEASKVIQAANTAINSESNVNFTDLSALQKESLENIREVVSNSLKSNNLTTKEKIDIFQQTKNLFSSNQSFFSSDDLSVPICLIDGDGNERSVKLSLEQCCLSGFFRNQFSEIFNEEGILIKETGELRVHLPENASIEDFHGIKNIDSINDINKLNGSILVASYIDMPLTPSKVNYRLQQICQGLENQELFDLITQMPHGFLSDDQISIILNAYIGSCFHEIKSQFTATNDYADTIANLLADKISDNKIQSAIKDRVIKLNLSDLDIGNQELHSIAEEIPSIVLLDVSKTKITEIPNVWLEKLQILNIIETGFSSLPTGLVNLERLDARFARMLIDISGLNNLKKLKEIHIDFTQISSAPIGCDNLEVFLCMCSYRLTDVSGLNNLKKLRESLCR